MDFKKQKPIYQQIADMLCERIAGGELRGDERMPSVRDVAVQLGVNPNTVMRTFDYLQQTEIIYNKRGMGYFVSADAAEKVLALHREDFIENDLPIILQKMNMLGLTIDELKKIIVEKNISPSM